MDIVYYKGWNKLKGNISDAEVLKRKNTTNHIVLKINKWLKSAE
jgi:hypothetical protein